MDNQDKIKAIEICLEKIDKKENQIIFYIGEDGKTPKASFLTTYKYAKYLKEEGFKVVMLHDIKGYEVPEWMGEGYSDLEHIIISSKSLKVSFNDIIIYPETHPDVMEKTKTINCQKVVLCQSYKNILSALPPTVDWFQFGISFVICTSESLSNYVKSIFQLDDYIVRTIFPSVDEDLFWEDETIFREPTVGIVARHQNDVLEIAKQFYATYPECKYLTFKDLRGFSMDDYSKFLNESFLGVWVDRESSFGQFPIEALYCGLPVIGVKPDMKMSYELPNLTLVDSKLVIPSMIHNALMEYITTPQLTNRYNECYENNYTIEKEKESVLSFFNFLNNKQSSELENLKNNLKK